MINEVAENYAGAMFSLARERSTVRKTKEEAETLLNVLDTDPELLEFFTAIKITDEEKKALVDEVFGEMFSADMIHLLKLLIDKNRIYCIEDVLSELVRMLNDELDIRLATVYSARPLKEEDLERIRAALAKRTGKEIVLRNRVDQSLIAGIKVVTDNSVTDITMKRRIDEMKRALLKGETV